MATLRYKKTDNTIKEVPIISNIYTEYVINNADNGSVEFTLTPTEYSNSQGKGMYSGVRANVSLLDYIPTISMTSNLKEILFSSQDWRNVYTNKFPLGLKIVLPNEIWLNKTTDYIAPPNKTTITNVNDIITIPKGYYSDNFNISIAAAEKSNIISNNLIYNTSILGVQGINNHNINTTLAIITNPTASNKSGASNNQILENYRAYVNGTLIEGSMPNQGYFNTKTLTPNNSILPTGYYTGGGTGLTANGRINIATGAVTITQNNKTYSLNELTSGDYYPDSINVQVPMIGIDVSEGTSQSSLDATKILSGYKVYGSGSTGGNNYILGTMQNRGSLSSITLSPSNVNSNSTSWESGFYSGGKPQVSVMSTKLQISVNGTYVPSTWGTSSQHNKFPLEIEVTVPSSGIDTTVTEPDEPAGAEHIYFGKKAFVNGSSVTGSMPVHNINYTSLTNIQTLTSQGSSYTIPAGYHNGYEKITASLTSSGNLNYTFSNTASKNYNSGYYSGGTISIDTTNLSAGNIKNNVTILGVKGTYTGESSSTLEDDMLDLYSDLYTVCGQNRSKTLATIPLIERWRNDVFFADYFYVYFAACTFSTYGIRWQLSSARYSSYLDYLASIGYDSTKQLFLDTDIPPYAFSYIDTDRTTNFGIGVILHNGLRGILPLAFYKSRAKYLYIWVTYQTSFSKPPPYFDNWIDDGALANSVFTTVDIEVNSGANLSIGHLLEYNGVTNGTVDNLNIICESGSYVNIDSSAFQNASPTYLNLRLYDPSSPNNYLNWSERPWGRSGLNITTSAI